MIYYIELLNQKFIEKLFVVYPISFKYFLKTDEGIKLGNEMSLKDKKFIYEKLKMRYVNTDYFITKIV